MEKYPVPLSVDVMNMCGEPGLKNLRVAEVRKVVEKRKKRKLNEIEK